MRHGASRQEATLTVIFEPDKMFVSDKYYKKMGFWLKFGTRTAHGLTFLRCQDRTSLSTSVDPASRIKKPKFMPVCDKSQTWITSIVGRSQNTESHQFDLIRKNIRKPQRPRTSDRKPLQSPV